MSKRILPFCAAALITASSALAADSKAYRTAQLRPSPQGGSRYIVFVYAPARPDTARVRTSTDAPYALTGNDNAARVRNYRAMPSNPRGTHNW